MVLISLTKAELRQRRWVKQRLAYLEDDVARWQAIIAKRLSVLEALLRVDLLSDDQRELMRKQDEEHRGD